MIDQGELRCKYLKKKERKKYLLEDLVSQGCQENLYHPENTTQIRQMVRRITDSNYRPLRCQADTDTKKYYRKLPKRRYNECLKSPNWLGQM